MMGRPAGVRPYQSLGELLIETTPAAAPVSAYRRTLDVATALATVSYTQNATAFTRELFASAPAGAIGARFTASKPRAVFTYGATMDLMIAHELLTNCILEWIAEYQETEPNHRHTSHLYGRHPASMITTATSELFEAAIKVFGLTLPT